MSAARRFEKQVETATKRHRRQWRFYRTATGNSPVRRFLDQLSDEDAAEVVGEMKHVEERGLSAGRHLAGDIYEVRASGADAIFHVLFAKEGSYGHVLLALDAFSKKTRKTPPAKISLAKQRLTDWRARGLKKDHDDSK